MKKANLKQVLLRIDNLNYKQLQIQLKYNNKSRYSTLKNILQKDGRNQINKSVSAEKLIKKQAKIHKSNKNRSSVHYFQSATGLNLNLKNGNLIQSSNNLNKIQSQQIEFNLKKKKNQEDLKISTKNNKPIKKKIFHTFLKDYKNLIIDQRTQKKKITIKKRSDQVINILQNCKYQYSDKNLDSLSFPFITAPINHIGILEYHIFNDLEHLYKLNNLIAKNVQNLGNQIFQSRKNDFFSIQQIDWTILSGIDKFEVTIINNLSLQYVNIKNCSIQKGVISYEKRIPINLMHCVNQLQKDYYKPTVQIFHLIIHQDEKMYYQEYIYNTILHPFCQKQNRESLMEYLMKRFLLFDKVRTRQTIILNSQYLIKNMRQLGQDLYSIWNQFMKLFREKYAFVSDQTYKIMEFNINQLFRDENLSIKQEKRIINKQKQQDILFNPQNPFIQFQNDYYIL